jgi:hypothetical protein
MQPDVHDELRGTDRLWSRQLRVCGREMQRGSIISPHNGTKITLIAYPVKPLSAMNVTTLHGIICMDYISGDHSCRKYPVPLSHRYCSARVHDNEGER